MRHEDHDLPKALLRRAGRGAAAVAAVVLAAACTADGDTDDAPTPTEHTTAATITCEPAAVQPLRHVDLTGV